MHYLQQWNAVSAHIEGLMRAAELDQRFGHVDSYGRRKRLGEHAKRILDSLREFRSRFGSHLPTAAAARLDQFFQEDGPIIELPYETESRAIAHGIVVLVALAAELSRLLADQQQILRSRTEVAFVHLQRLLAVDPDVRAKWLSAFNDPGETECERLGAVHLLWHHIWAFKAHAGGGRTDLVFPEPPPLELLERSSAALVLTEWKVAADAKVAATRFNEARKQADAYKQGVLAAAELTDTRYLVVVTMKQVPIPADDVSGGVTYRHINIAIDPDSPSVTAKKKGK